MLKAAAVAINNCHELVMNRTWLLLFRVLVMHLWELAEKITLVIMIFYVD